MCYIEGMAEISSAYDRMISLARARRVVTTVVKEWLEVIDACRETGLLLDRIVMERERVDLLAIQNEILKRFLACSGWRPRRGG